MSPQKLALTKIKSKKHDEKLSLLQTIILEQGRIAPFKFNGRHLQLVS